PDPRAYGWVVLREPEAVAPEVRGRLVLLLVSPGLLRRGPLAGDLAGGGARAHRLDRVVEPLQRRGVVVLLLLGGLLADAVRAIVAGLVAVPGERGEIHEDDVAGPDDPIGEVAPVGPGVRPRA